MIMNKWKYSWIFLILVALLSTGCQEEGLLQVMLVTGGEHTLEGDVPAAMVITGGDIVQEDDSGLAGPVLLLDGALEIEGTVKEDIFAFGGTLVLADQARILGSLNHGGGEIVGQAERAVAGKVNTGTGLQIPDVKPQPRSLFSTAVRWIISALFLGGLTLLVEKRFSSRVQHVQEAIIEHGVISGAMGVLVGIVGVSLIVLLIYTILLIPVALLGFALMVISVIYGWMAIGICLGKWAAKRFFDELPEPVAIAAATGLFFIFMNMINLIPYAGGLIGIGVALVSLGGVFLTRFGYRRFVPEQTG
jgi:hypothetical protein